MKYIICEIKQQEPNMAMMLFLDSMITEAIEYCDNLPKPVNLSFKKTEITDKENSLLIIATFAILFVMYIFCYHSTEIYNNQLYDEFKRKNKSPKKICNEYWRRRSMYTPPVKRKNIDKMSQQEMAKRRRESLRSFKKIE